MKEELEINEEIIMQEEIKIPKQLIMDDFPNHIYEETNHVDLYNSNYYNYKNILYYICQFIRFKIN